MYFRPTGKLEVVDDKGKVVEKEDFAPLPVLRERSSAVRFPAQATS